MDINSVCLSGKITQIGVNKTTGLYPVVEARLIVNGGAKDGQIIQSVFNVRSYGKKSLKISTLREGELVTIEGRLVEDIRVNSFDPSSTRSKTYINIDRLKSFSQEAL